MAKKGIKKLLTWTMTAWAMNGEGGWQTQPVILIEGRIPFFADHPEPYITKLLEMHDDPQLLRGPIHTLCGQLKDGMEQSWQKEKVDAKSAHRNGDG